MVSGFLAEIKNQTIMKPILFAAALVVASSLTAQNAETYVNKSEETHLCGPVTITDLMNHGDGWYQQHYDEFETEQESHLWKKQLKNTQVDIYLGSWCGDSKNWVPQFVHLWDELGLDREQLNIVALYDGDEKYKQGPNHEEKGLDIHRVPTFIFKEDGQEIGRIVEFPSTDLETDLAQIALGYPSAPNYHAATYFQDLLAEKSISEIYEDANAHFYKVYKKVSKSSELNTLGYVMLRSDRVDEALLVFNFNTYLFRHEPNVYDSYGEALTIKGDTVNAIKCYEKVLELDSANENAVQQLALLKTESENQ